MNEHISGVYQIKGPNDKVYYGQTIDWADRKRDHLSALRGDRHDNPHLQNSFNKYGESAFTFEFIKRVPWAYLSDVEQNLIDGLWGTARLYNIARCAEASARGLKRSAETCAKLSASRKGYKHTPEAKARMKKPHFLGVPRTPEVKAKISLKHKGKILTEEHRAKLSAAKLGRTISAEIRAKMSLAQKGRKHTPESREKIRQAKLKMYADRKVGL